MPLVSACPCRPAAFGTRGLSLLLAVCGLLLSSPGPALAHGMYVFAWPEGGQICAEGYYSSQRKVQGGRTQAENTAGTIVAQGMSDGQGRWCFTPQAGEELKVVYVDDQGHRAEFVIAATGEPGLSTASPATAPSLSGKATNTAESAAPDGLTTQAAPTATAPTATAPQSRDEAAPDAGVATVQEEQMRSWVRTEMQAQLVPLYKALAERDEPRLRDIVGGLGWIVGLLGLGAYFLQRRMHGPR